MAAAGDAATAAAAELRNIQVKIEHVIREANALGWQASDEEQLVQKAVKGVAAEEEELARLRSDIERLTRAAGLMVGSDDPMEAARSALLEAVTNVLPHLRRGERERAVPAVACSRSPFLALMSIFLSSYHACLSASGREGIIMT